MNFSAHILHQFCASPLLPTSRRGFFIERREDEGGAHTADQHANLHQGTGAGQRWPPRLGDDDDFGGISAPKIGKILKIVIFTFFSAVEIIYFIFLI
jgi:hypothetical protein